MATQIIVENSQDISTNSKTWGASFIVAGTTIGAGMLTFPVISSTVGILPALGILVFMWYFMYQAAIYSYKINQLEDRPHNISFLASKYIHPIAGKIGTFMLLFLLYALVCAYLMGGASLLSTFFTEYLGISITQKAAIGLYTAVFAGLICWRMQLLDASNRVLFITMIGVFFLMMGVLFHHIKMPTLVSNIQHTDFAAIGIALPLLFTAFGFHGSIPSVLQYIGIKNEKDVKFAFCWGTLVPLVIFTLWILLSVSVIPFFGENSFEGVRNAGGDVSLLISALSSHAPFSMIQHLGSIFTFLAIATSLIGVGLGLFDFHMERLGEVTPVNRFIAGFWTFIIPIIVTALTTDAFLRALSYGGMALSFIAILLPCIIMIKQRMISTLEDKIKVTVLMVLGIAVTLPSIIHILKTVKSWVV